ncbi:MAG TPA: efflux RND transporter permease subunit [Edaphobacter sp.]
MNPGVYSIKHSRIVFALTFIFVVGGIFAYLNLGRLEDPEFTIKQALIVTQYPGASPEEVAREVTNPIESACQQMGQVDRVESESTRGRSLVRVHIKDQYHKDRIQQVWDELRRKVNDAQPRLPPSVRGTSLVVDDFGDVYSVFMAITGKGFSQPELRRYVDAVRRELQLVPGVAKVDLFSEQQEVVFLEMSRPRLARLGINENQIYAQLQAKNVVADGGRVRIGDQHIPIDPTGGFNSADDMLDLVIGSDSSGHQLQLRDVATIERSYEDPPRRLLRYDGQQAIGIGISTVPGGNVVTMGKGVLKKLEEIKQNQPVGIEFHDINFQPTAVTEATRAFTFNLFKAVTIVIVVLLFAMGRKAGLMMGFVLFITIIGTFMVMKIKGGLSLERISLGALIIALCMLTDNAIVITEGLKIGIEAGRDKLEVCRDVIAHNQWPLFGATGIAILAFAAIGLSEDSAGELLSSLFWVICISLTLSWITAITVTPLLAYLFFKPSPDGHSEEHAYDGRFFQTYLRLLRMALRFRFMVLAVTILIFFLSLYGFTRVDQSFFPPATRPQFMIDTFLQSGTHIRVSEQYADQVERYLLAQPGVTHVTSFVGGGALRFLLVYSAEQPNTAYVQFLVEVDDWRKVDGLVPKIQKYLEENYPNANTNTKKFQLGPGSNGRVQVRFSGPDPATLRALAGQAQGIIEDSGEAVGVRTDWRQPEKIVRPKVLELQAHRNGLTRVDVAQVVESGFEGRTVGFYRQPGGTGTGIFPQETRILPIIARPPLAERSDVDQINNMQIWSPVAGRMIPMSQVVSGTEVVWEDPIIMRRDRMPTVTLLADGRGVLPSVLMNAVREKIEQIPLPPGYKREWGGEYEDSNNARESLAEPLPAAVLGMVFIVVCLFNSFRATAVICLAVPLAIIGAVAGLLLTNNPFGFMALLGLLSLGGEQVKNSVVLLEEIFLQIHHGKEPYAAILQAGVSRLRPVLLVVVTTVLGMIPLLMDPFFSNMAAVIMFGLAFAAVLTMIVVPALYAIFFRVRIPDPELVENQ